MFHTIYSSFLIENKSERPYSTRLLVMATLACNSLDRFITPTSKVIPTIAYFHNSKYINLNE